MASFSFHSADWQVLCAVVDVLAFDGELSFDVPGATVLDFEELRRRSDVPAAVDRADARRQDQ